MNDNSQHNLNFNTARAVPVRAPIRNPLTLVFLWCSKTDPHLVALCSRWAIATQAALGVFVVFTALLAFGGMYYTLSAVNAPASRVPPMALAWSCFIFFLDREIAGSLDKLSAVVRPLLALVIGTLVAIPIELWIFQPRIDQDLQHQWRRDNKEQLDALGKEQVLFDQRRLGLQASIADLRKQEAEWGKVMDDELVGRPKLGRTGVRGAGPVFENAQTQQSAVRARTDELRADLDRLERTQPAERERWERQFGREEVTKTTDFVTRYEAMDRLLRSSDALYRLSWLIMLTLILIEMTPALLKVLTPHSDYHHLARAVIRENTTLIDELGEGNYRKAIEHPEVPELSVAEKFARVRHSPISDSIPFGRPQ